MNIMDCTHSQKNIFAVIGIGRSGTSVVARSLKVLGIDLGHNLLKGDERNPKGFWEDADILYRINRGVSRVLGEPWTSFGSMNKTVIENNPALKDYHVSAQKILKERLAQTNCWGFKDPRTTTILPFWQSVFESLKIQDHYVIVVRNPLSVAHSHLTFAKTDLEMGLLLWLMHLFTAIEETHGKRRVVVNYESMLKNPHKELDRMRYGFALPLPLNVNEVNLFEREFIDKKLSHHQFTDEEFNSHFIGSVFPLSVTLFDLLMRLAKDEIGFDSQEFESEWKMIKKEFLIAYPVFQYLQLQRKRYHLLEKELRNIHQSFSWKLMYPFIKTKKMLKTIRRKYKEINRTKGLTASSS